MINLKGQELEDLYEDKKDIIIMLGYFFLVNQNNSLKNFLEYNIINEKINELSSCAVFLLFSEF